MREKLKKAFLTGLALADYDVYKSLDPETAEDPEEAAQELEFIIDAVSAAFTAGENNESS